MSWPLRSRTLYRETPQGFPGDFLNLKTTLLGMLLFWENAERMNEWVHDMIDGRHKPN